MSKNPKALDLFLSNNRIQKTTVSRKRVIDDFFSDRSRILFCSSFRRLQQKAQVFSLESNSNIRTRLSHSLEVSDIGRTLANDIGYKLLRAGRLNASRIQSLVAVVENACLLHDIGNPPFGHFGETAIKDWARSQALSAFPNQAKRDNPTLKEYMKDFEEFDGNPQGFRLVTKVQTDRDENGLNLTYATLLCILKYSRCTDEKAGKGILKKAGYFQTEKDIVDKLVNGVKLGMNCRYPFTYIMEAADDIAYCTSDIADGIEKGILSYDDFREAFVTEWKKKYPDTQLNEKKLFPKEPIGSFQHDISIHWSGMASKEACKVFLNDIDNIALGKRNDGLITDDSEIGKVLETTKAVSRKILYTSFEAENIELTGYSVITGILTHYEKLLKVDSDDFQRMIKGEISRGFDIERRLFNRLSKHSIRAYNYAVDKLDKGDSDYHYKEWWLRVHLIIDHLSGMTDEFALRTYQMLEGINLMSR